MLFKRGGKEANNFIRGQRTTNAAGRRSRYSYYGIQPEPKTSLAGRNISNKTSKNTKSRWRHLPTILAASLIVFCLVYETLLGSQPRFVLLNSASDGGLTLNLSSYQEAAHSLLSGSVANRDKLTIDTAAIADKLQQKFPELSNVSITLPIFGHRPIIYIEPAKAVMVLNTQNGGSFLIDTNGKAIQRLNGQTNSLSRLPTVSYQANQSVSFGQVVLSENDVAFIQLVSSQLSSKNITLKSMVLPAESRELDVNIKGASYVVKFNLNDYASDRQQVGTFLVTKQYLDSHNITPTGYVDVRVPGRVYYK